MSTTFILSRFLALAIVIAALVPAPARAHFTLNGSRDQAAWPSDNRRFFPIQSGGALRPILDCLQIAKGAKQTIAAGSTQTFSFEIGNHAKHVGPCTAALVDPATGQSTFLGSQADCVNKFEAMTVTIPPTATCTDCVVKINVMATHLGVANAEYYDSCIDVDVSGGSGGSSGPHAQVDTPAATPSSAPAAPAAPAPTTAPAAPEAPAYPDAPAAGSCSTPGAFSCAGANSFQVCSVTREPIAFTVPAGYACTAGGPAGFSLIAA